MDETQENRLWAQAVERQHDQERTTLLQPALMSPSEALSSPNDINHYRKDKSAQAIPIMPISSVDGYRTSHQGHDAASAALQPGHPHVSSHLEHPLCIDPRMLEIKQAPEHDGFSHVDDWHQSTSLDPTASHGHYGGYSGCVESGLLPARSLQSSQEPYDMAASGLHKLASLSTAHSTRYEQARLPLWHDQGSSMTADTDASLRSEHTASDALGAGDFQYTYHPALASHSTCTYTTPNPNDAVQGPFSGLLQAALSNRQHTQTAGFSSGAANLLALPYEDLVANHIPKEQWRAVEHVLEYVLHVSRTQSGQGGDWTISPTLWSALKAICYELVVVGEDAIA